MQPQHLIKNGCSRTYTPLLQLRLQLQSLRHPPLIKPYTRLEAATTSDELLLRKASISTQHNVTPFSQNHSATRHVPPLYRVKHYEKKFHRWQHTHSVQKMPHKAKRLDAAAQTVAPNRSMLHMRCHLCLHHSV
jgi:hypothetical protein